MIIEQNGQTFKPAWGENTFLVDIKTHNGYQTFIVLADSTKQAISKVDKQILQDYFGADTKSKPYRIMGCQTHRYEHKRHPTKFAYMTYVDKRDLEALLATNFVFI